MLVISDVPYSRKFSKGFIFKNFENGQAFLKNIFSKLLDSYYRYTLSCMCTFTFPSDARKNATI